MEAVGVGDDFLEGGSVNLVADGLSVDGIPDRSVLDLEDPVVIGVEVQPAGLFDQDFIDGIAHAVRIEIRARHRMSFFVDQPIIVPVDCRINPKREYVLVVHSQHARVYNSTPGHFDTFVDWLRADNTGSADLILDFASLIEDEGHDVLVVCNSDDRLDDELSVTDNGS